MLRAVIFLQLTLWVASIHAFFPYIPAWQCEENHICEDDTSSDKVKARGVQTYKLSQRTRNANRDPSTSAAKEASRLLRKHKPSRTANTQPDLTRRDNKYAVASPAPPSVSNAVGIYQDGTDFSYFIQVEFGSSGKALYMLLDTGAGTTWVMGTDCQSSACTMHNSFGPSDSTTYTATTSTFSISYGSGNVAGVLAKDTIAVAAVSLSMSFGVASNASNDFTHFPFDGILGVSMSRGATDNFLTAMKTSNALKSNLFGVSLSRNSDGPNTGEVSFGGIDASKYTGEISYTAVSTKAGGDWAIPLDDFAYDGQTAGIKNRLAYIDTGTSYMFGPPEDVALLHKLVPGSKSNNGFAYTVPCDSDKTLTVTFSGVAYTLSPKDWMSPPVNDVCTSNFYGQAVVQDSWLLGDSFLKNVYTVFDADQTRIGFAPKPEAPASTTSTSASTASSSTPTSTSTADTSDGSSSATVVTTAKPVTGTSTPASSLPGLSGHETSAAQGTPVAQTAGPTATPTVSSPGEQLEGNKYASIICIVAVIAMVA